MSILFDKKGVSVMEGYFFLAGSWIAIILIFFFLSKKIPPILCIHLLIMIVLSQYWIPAGEQQLNTAILYMAAAACFYIGHLKFKSIMNMVVLSFLLALAKSGYYLYSMLEPLWFLWLPSWVDNALLAYMAIILLQNNGQRMITMIMGMVISDLFVFFSHAQSGLYYPLFTHGWLDEMAMCFIFLLGWNFIEMISRTLYEHTKHFHKKEV